MNILKKSFYSLTMTSIVLLMSGCIGSSNPEPKVQIPIPNWYINAPSSNHINLYGTIEVEIHYRYVTLRYTYSSHSLKKKE